jgi:hypothetical protein
MHAYCHRSRSLSSAFLIAKTCMRCTALTNASHACAGDVFHLIHVVPDVSMESGSVPIWIGAHDGPFGPPLRDYTGAHSIGPMSARLVSFLASQSLNSKGACFQPFCAKVTISKNGTVFWPKALVEILSQHQCVLRTLVDALIVSAKFVSVRFCACVCVLARPCACCWGTTQCCLFMRLLKSDLRIRVATVRHAYPEAAGALTSQPSCSSMFRPLLCCCSAYHLVRLKLLVALDALCLQPLSKARFRIVLCSSLC